MFLQRVTGSGVLRQFHVNNVFAGPTRVMGVQNQLRQLFLSARPVAKIPLNGSRIVALQHSHSYRTKAETSEDKPKKAPNKKAAAKKPTKPLVKKPLTEKQKEKQKETKKKQKARAELAELKKTALEPPTKLPKTTWRVAFREMFPQSKGETNSENFALTIAAVKNLSDAELEPFREQAEKNRATNESELSSWLKTFTPKQILDANKARLALTRLTGKRWPALSDDRLVKNVRPSYFLFMQDHANEYPGQPVTQVTTLLSQVWKGLSDAEKEPYIQKANEDKARYIREYKEVYGVDAPVVERSKSSA
ncbi:hypothetical protein N7495_005617 [Penicillium taxi]|uniref:uncharacterized protein n=1 Tax=Penicillium taxi TaxID=168475 RepID=UPI0025453F2D|nr:uncharacterized protein N7495_005617 [Penicillium taxi]KAJ5893926.1 hypothetical protein N7495_005617 [Penicillium taxi]